VAEILFRLIAVSVCAVIVGQSVVRICFGLRSERDSVRKW